MCCVHMHNRPSSLLCRTRSLQALRHLQRAASGQRGRKQRKVGVRGADCVLRVPLGTVVFKQPPRAPPSDDAWQQPFLAACVPGRAVQMPPEALSHPEEDCEGGEHGDGWGGGRACAGGVQVWLVAHINRLVFCSLLFCIPLRLNV